jgi:hypothetical protein
VGLTLAQLRTASKNRADMANSNFIGESELDLYINNGYSELYDLLVSKFEDYFSQKTSFFISSGNTYTLPSTVYKIRGIDYGAESDVWIPLKKANFAERPLRTSDVTGSYQLWDIPRFTRLVNASDEMSDVLDFEDYVIVDAAIKMKTKEESDISALMAQKQMLIARINSMASNRDAGSPEKIADIYQDPYRLYPKRTYRLMGNTIYIYPANEDVDFYRGF